MSAYEIAVKALIGTALQYPELAEEVGARLHPGDIADPIASQIYKAAIDLAVERIPIDHITLSSRLEPGTLSAQLFAELCQVGSASNYTEYLEIVRNEALKRKLMSACLDMTSQMKSNPGVRADELLGKLHSSLASIDGQSDRGQGLSPVAELLPEYLKGLKDRVGERTGITGLASGYEDLDEMTAGFQPGDLVVLAARPSMGKTTLAMNIIERIAEQRKRVLVFSMEMPKEALLQRTISSLGSIKADNLRKGRLTPKETGSLAWVSQKISELDILIDDTCAMTATELRLRALRAHREAPVSAVMVDYLQLMSGADCSTKDGRTQQITHISRALKMLAKDLNCPVIALSQLNRELERRPDKRPINSDLRESGAIEQDADLILFVYRDIVYNEDSPDGHTAEIIIGKHRNGPIGTVRLGFEGHYSRFTNLVKTVNLLPQHDIDAL